MTIILTGATGFTGGEVLQQLLADPSIEQVIVLVRRSVGLVHPKLKEIVVKDFLDYSSVRKDLKADACIWCLGVSQTAVTEKEYIRITFDYTMAAARAMLAENPNTRFCFLSGSRAVQDENSKLLYARIKGRAERELSVLSPNVFNFRPAFIKPAHPGQKRPLIPTLFIPIAWVIDRFTDTFSIKVDKLAHCLIDVAKKGTDQKILDNRMILHYGQ